MSAETRVRVWRSATATEAIAFSAGKTNATAEHGYGWASEFTQYFTDGSALRITAENGHVYSEHTEDGPTLCIEVSEG